MSTFRSILPFNLKENIIADEFESFINNKYKPTYLTIDGFTDLELLKKVGEQDTIFEQPSPDYLIIELWQDTESHHQIWKQENMEAIQKTLGPQVWEALTKLHEEYGDRVGSYHSVVIT